MSKLRVHKDIYIVTYKAHSCKYTAYKVHSMYEYMLILQQNLVLRHVNRNMLHKQTTHISVCRNAFCSGIAFISAYCKVCPGKPKELEAFFHLNNNYPSSQKKWKPKGLINETKLNFSGKTNLKDATSLDCS